MSKHNNVNPGQYKVGGRERPDDMARERVKGARKQKTKTSQESRNPRQRGQKRQS